MSKRALCIGIDSYKNGPLRGCLNDVSDWAIALNKRGFQVETLKDKNATKLKMIEEIKKLIANSLPGDTAVLQYSGHGSYVDDVDGDEPDGRDEVLCPYDIGPSTFLSDDELYDLFAKVKPGVRLVFFSDSCHSGTVSRFMEALGAPTNASRSRFLPPETFISKSRLGKIERVANSPSAGPGPHHALLFSGCMDNQTSADAYLNNRFNGAFTFYALKALNTLPAKATYREWHAAIRKLLPNASYSQQPNLFGSDTQKSWVVFADEADEADIRGARRTLALRAPITEADVVARVVSLIQKLKNRSDPVYLRHSLTDDLGFAGSDVKGLAPKLNTYFRPLVLNLQPAQLADCDTVRDVVELVWSKI